MAGNLFHQIPGEDDTHEVGLVGVDEVFPLGDAAGGSVVLVLLRIGVTAIDVVQINGDIGALQLVPGDIVQIPGIRFFRKEVGDGHNPNIDICKMKFSKSALISSNMKLNCGMKVLVKDSKTTNGRDIRVNSKKLSV